MNPLATKPLALSLVCLFAAALGTSGTAQAQAPVLPRVSPSEQMIGDANRTIRSRELRQQQDNNLQFELNALREQRIRQEVFPRLTGPQASPNVGTPCMPSTPAC